MNELQIFNNPKFGQVRTLQTSESVLFGATDIARALGYVNPNDAILRHCRGIVKHEVIENSGFGPRKVTINFIPEGDIYRLTIKSELPGAEQFESWIFDEVLPTIRKTGGYSMVPKTFAEALRLAADLEEEKQRLLPKAQGYDYLMNASGTVTIGEAAKIIDIKGIGPNKFFKLLVAEEIIFKRGNSYLPYSDYKEHFIVKQNPITIGDTLKERSQLYLSMADLDWLVKFLSKRGYQVNYTAQKCLV